jgi:hypothetical protein
LRPTEKLSEPSAVRKRDENARRIVSEYREWCKAHGIDWCSGRPITDDEKPLNDIC